MNRCGDDCRSNGERQPNAKRTIEKSTEWRTRTEQDQQVVTKDRGRQYERQRDECVNEIAAGKTLAREQPREGGAGDERDQRRSSRDSERKPDGEPVDHGVWRTAYQTFSDLCLCVLQSASRYETANPAL